MTHKQTSSLAGACVVASCALVWFVATHTSTPLSGPVTAVETWQHMIGREGASGAYELLARAVARENPGTQHQAAHAFGHALYVREGNAGLSTCDSRFSFGCFHEFLAQAIADQGLASVATLNRACIETLTQSPLSCQHGIGHGVVAEIGYEEPDVRTALDLCAQLPGIDPIGGCYGGVFMEYNHRTMWGANARAREGNMREPFALCSALPSAYGPACAFWIPQWWEEVFRSTLPTESAERAARFGAWCETEEFATAHKEACFEGIGNIASFSGQFDPVRVRAVCMNVSHLPEHQLWCARIAANHMGLDRGKEAGEAVCKTLPYEERRECEAYARNELNIARRAQ